MRKKYVNYDKIQIAQDCVNKICKPNAFFSSFWQALHKITMLLPYFAPFTGYEDNICEGISDLHIQR